MITIINLVKQTLEPGNYATMQILRQFKGAQPLSWQQLLEKSNVSKVTLSKTLKALVERGVLKKQVIVGFPPRTQYMLNPDLDKDVYNFLAFQGKYMDKIENYAQALLDLAQAHAHEGSYAEFVDLAIKQFNQTMLRDVVSEVRVPITSKHESWHSLLATQRAYILLLDYFVLVQALTVDPKMQSLALKLLAATQKEVEAMPRA
jgi:DNA-binding HxlR family transcriptional regulator